MLAHYSRPISVTGRQLLSGLLTGFLLTAGPLLAQPTARPPAAPATDLLLALRNAPPVADRQRVLREQLHLTAADEMRLLRTETDELGFVHERFQPYYRGVKVEHASISLHERGGKIETLSGTYAPPAASASAQPALSAEAARQRALAAVGARRYKWQEPAEEAALQVQSHDANATYFPKGELVWVGDFRQSEANRPIVLAWKYNVYAAEPVSRAWVYVDARTGQVVMRNAIIKHANAPGATMTTRYVGARVSTTDNTGSAFRLRETVSGKGVTTLNLRKSQTLSTAVDFTDNDNNWTAAEHDNINKDNAVLDAHVGAQATQQYWTNVHGRDSYDDRGTVLLSYVHYGNNVDNAFWNGTAMLYGDGNTLFKPLTSIDVCAHEVGHAVMDATADLVYQGESGGLNEGFSDIWGCAVENFFDPTKQKYLIGEDITLPAFGTALRSMSNPNAHNQPDTYLGTNWQPTAVGQPDNGGVHTNSGVLNFWFYLLSEGGAGTNDNGTAFSVTGISIAKAEKIAYRAQRFYITSTTNYAGARRTTLQAAIDLYGLGSAEVTAVAQAWKAVGLGEIAPTLTGFSPTSGLPGTVVTLTGTNLGLAFSVTFNGVPATIATITSSTSISVVVPPTATTGTITVTTPTGSATSGASFTLTNAGPAPTLTSFAPPGGARATAAVTLTGANFTGATGVTFNSTAAVFAVTNATTISTTVPAGATTGVIQVTTPNGTASAAAPFPVLPHVASFAPTAGAVGASIVLTGTTLTGALDVKFNGVYAPTYTVNSATQITVTVPTGAATGPITVRTASGLATTATNFTVNPTLAFTSFSPQSGAVNTTVVNIRGLGFTGTTAITFGGVNAPAFTVATDVELFVTVPAGAISGNIVLTTPLGTATSPTAFTVTAPLVPTITSFTPTSGVVSDPVTITGTNFTSATAVTFNGTAAAFTFVNATTLFTSVPAGATTGVIRVTVPGGTATSASSFSVLVPGAPAISSFTPANGNPGTLVTLTGTNFAGTTAVAFNGTAAAFTLVSSTSITTTAPAGGTTGQISATSGFGTGLSATSFFYPPTNDLCANTGLPVLACGGSVTGTTVNSTSTGDPTGTCGTAVQATAGGVFYRFVGTGGSVTVSTCAAGTNYDTKLFVFTGTCGSYTCVGGNDDVASTCSATGNTNPSIVTFASVAGTNYFVFVSGFNSNKGNFTLTATCVPVTPTISSFTPTSGVVGTSVGITGTNLTAASAVTFNGTAATTVTVNSATSITATVPAGATTGPIGVTVPGGSGVSASNFTVIPAPTLTSLTPNSGLVGASITLAGTNFTGATGVSFNGTAAVTFSVTNATTATATVPAGATSGNVTITTASGTSNGVAFTVVPSLSSLTLSAGSLSPAFAPATTAYALSTTSASTTAIPTNAQAGGGPITVNGTPVASGTASGAIALAPGANTLTVVVNPPGAGPATTYIVTVTRTCAVTALAQNVSVTLDVNGNATVAAPAVNNGSSSTCGAVSLSVSPSSFTCANLGANAVTLTVTDGFGGSATAPATVTVSAPALASTTWTGAASTDWTSCANWSYGLVPAAAVSAVLPAGMPRYPVLSSGTTPAADVTIAAAAGLTLNSGATLQVHGNWTNHGTATLSGAVQFAGGAAQALGGSMATSFTVVSVNKTIGSSVSLTRDLAIVNSLALTSGTLLTTAAFKVALGAVATLTETTGAYVTGAVEATRLLTTAGTAETFGGLGLTLTPSGSTLPGSTTVRRLTGTPLSGVLGRQGIARAYDVVAAVNAGLNVALTFGYFDHELNGIAEGNLALFRSVSGAGGPWANQTPTTRDALANTVSKIGVTGFSVWTLGDAQAPLPVALTQFTATPEGPAAVRLAWATASEKNSDRFEVERSADGRTFGRIGTVAAASSSSSARTYELLDTQVPRTPSPQVPIYYRLRQVNTDATFSYSPVRTVVLKAAPAGLVLAPNPGRATTLSGAQPGAAVTVYDALGRLVLTATADAAGAARLVLPAGLPAGVYLVRTGARALRLAVE